MKRLVRGVFCLLAVVLTIGVSSANAMTVPTSECFHACTPSGWITTPECFIASETCVRVDSEVITVSEGQGEDVIGGSMTCDNCDGDTCDECNENPPPPMQCTQTLSVSYTESISSSVAAGIEGGALIKATLESSIGHADARSETFQATCGSSSFPPCAKGQYHIKLGVTKNIQKRIDHNYTYTVVWGGTCPSTEVYRCTKQSTATGDSYGSAACDWGGYSACW